MLVAPDVAAVDQGQGSIQGAVIGRILLQGAQQLVPDAGQPPAAIAGRDRVPRAIPLGQIPPGSTGPQDPGDAIEHGAVGASGATGRWALWGKERGDSLPLLIGQFMASLRAHAPGLPRLCTHALVR